MNRRTFGQRVAGVVASLAPLRLAGCRPRATSSAAFADLRDRYFRGSLERNPVTSTYLGGDGYDPTLITLNGRLRDYSAPAISEEILFLERHAQALAAVDMGELAVADRIDHSVMRSQIAYLLRRLRDERHHERSLDSYNLEPYRGVDFQLRQLQTIGDGRRGSESEWDQIVQRSLAIPGYLEVARSNLAAGRRAGRVPDRSLVRRTLASAQAQSGFFSGELGRLAGPAMAGQPFARTLRREVDRAGAAAGVAYNDYVRFLDDTYDAADPTRRFAIGEDEYAWRLRECFKDQRTPAQLWAQSEDWVREREQAVWRVAEEGAREARLGLRFDSPGARRASTRALYGHLGAHSPRSDAELFGWLRESIARAIAYGRERSLFDVPAGFQVEVVTTPAVLQPFIDATAYYPAPPFKRAGNGQFFLTPTGDDRARLRRFNRASIAALATFQAFPGHDWHFRSMARHSSLISAVRWFTPGSIEDSFAMWHDSVATEGWGAYAEAMMGQPAPERPHGFYTAAEHLLVLRNQLAMAVAARLDLGLHTGRWSVEEALDYYAERGAMLPNARARTEDLVAQSVARRAEALLDRMVYSVPMLAMTFVIGHENIADLRRQFLARHPSQNHAFHERKMALGPIPIGHYREHFLRDETPRAEPAPV